MQFVQSIWLWAMAGIAVPVIIHLWNVKQGKTRKVGSIAFLTEAARSHAKSLRLSEWLLLLLRTLLLIVLAFLLCGPFLQTQDNVTKEKGWILLEKGNAKEAYQKFSPTVDSLLKAGFAFHYFTKGFTEAKLEEAIKKAPDTLQQNTGSYWSLVKELDQRVPAKLPLFLFTGNRLSRFTGNRPAIALNLHWKTYTADTTSVPVSKFVKPIADTSLTIYVYADKNGAGAHYLKAAFDAVSELTKRKIKTMVVSNASHITEKYDWLFWLSDTQVPASLVKNNVFLYEKGKERDLTSAIITGNHPPAGEELQVFKMIEHKNSNPVWKNGYGDALLSKDSTNPVYHFYSRFDPQWNNLVWSKQFPQIMYELVLPTENEAADLSGRLLVDEQQVQPTIVEEGKGFPKKSLLHTVDLTKLFWIAAFILFLLERIIAYHKKKGAAYG